MRKFLIHFIILSMVMFLAGCSSRAPQVIEAERVTGLISKKIYKNYQLRVYAYGGSMMEKIEEIDVNFKKNDLMTIQQARMLYIDVMEEGLAIVNSDLKIRPFLNSFPFTHNDLVIHLSFDNPDRSGKWALPPYFAFITLCLRESSIMTSTTIRKTS